MHPPVGLAGRGLPVSVLRNDDHFGYGASSNRGARSSTADYLLFLNTDTRVTKNAIARAVAYLDDSANNNVGILGVQMVDDCGQLARPCSRFPSSGKSSLPRFDWDHLTTREVDQVMGAFTLMRRPLFQKLRGYDERFFVYMEDVDLALRTHRLECKSVYLAEAAVFHAGGGTAANVTVENPFFNLRSRIQYGFKHFARHEALALLLVIMLLEPVTRLALALARGSLKTASVTMSAYLRLWLAFPKLRARL